MISPEHIQEFKELMKKEYGVEYTDAEAHEAATNLVGYFEVLMKMDYEQKQKANKKLSGDTEKRRVENASNSKPNDR
jgi:hypothetical protein